MRVRMVFALWWLLLTFAWWWAAGPLMVGVGVGAPSFVWHLRQHALYLSGVWAIGMMSLVMLLALRRPWMEAPLGGMDKVYRLHKWAGIGAAVFAVLHWGAKESSSWLKAVWGSEGRLAHDPVLAWATEWRGWGNDLGEWAFYALLIMVVLTLWEKTVALSAMAQLAQSHAGAVFDAGVSLANAGAAAFLAGCGGHVDRQLAHGWQRGGLVVVGRAHWPRALQLPEPSTCRASAGQR